MIIEVWNFTGSNVPFSHRAVRWILIIDPANRDAECFGIAYTAGNGVMLQPAFSAHIGLAHSGSLWKKTSTKEETNDH